MNWNLTSGQELFQSVLLIILVIFAVILLIIVGIIFRSLKAISYKQAGLELEPITPTSIWNRLNSLRPMKEEQQLLLDHDYDGIKELDNHLPPWWLGLLYGGVVFAVIYMFNYHIWQINPLSGEEYEQEMQLAMANKNENASPGASIDENNVAMITDAAELETGKTIYTANCAVCHGGAGEGGVGPNLTDKYWIHGGSINNIYQTITHGVTEKGMIAWEGTLKPQGIQQVSSYILTLQGTNPANGKAPQGTEFIAEAASEEVASDSTSTN